MFCRLCEVKNASTLQKALEAFTQSSMAKSLKPSSNPDTSAEMSSPRWTAQGCQQVSVQEMPTKGWCNQDVLLWAWYIFDTFDVGCTAVNFQMAMENPQIRRYIVPIENGDFQPATVVYQVLWFSASCVSYVSLEGTWSHRGFQSTLHRHCWAFSSSASTFYTEFVVPRLQALNHGRCDWVMMAMLMHVWPCKENSRRRCNFRCPFLSRACIKNIPSTISI